MSVKPKLVRVTANCIKLRHETASLQCNNSACRKLVVLAAWPGMAWHHITLSRH